MKKSSNLYKWILFIFLLISLSIIIPLVFKVVEIFSKQSDHSLTTKIFIVLLLVFNAIIFLIFWFKSTRDLVFNLFFLFKKKILFKKYDPIIKSNLTREFNNKRVVLLYCTCDDFNESVLKKSMFQDYKNYKVVILDDSKKAEYIEKIDKFSKKYNIEIIRRQTREGFKAGNLNNYLKNRVDYDYFVVLDSDEIIPNNFITQALKYFQFDKKIGGVQAHHIIDNKNNLFQQTLSLSGDVYGLSWLVMRNFYGETSLLGHGMMLSKEAYDKTGGFPHIIVEDTSMSAEMKKYGYKVVYAPNIICYEDFPPNYISLKKRQFRWTSGNVHYIKKYGKQNKKNGYMWFEKIDLKVNHYALPTIPVLSIIFLINFLILGFLKLEIKVNNILFLVVWLFFLFVPLLFSSVQFTKQRRAIWIIPEFIFTIITYTAMNFSLAYAAILGLFNKKIKFVVTPKENEKLKFTHILVHSIIPFLFGLIIAIVTYFSWKTVLPTLIVWLPCLLSPLVIASSNLTLNKQKRQKKVKVYEG